MSARLATAPSAPVWSVPDCLDAVEKRCRKLIQPALATESDPFAMAARAADYHLHAGGGRIRARLALDAALQLGLSARTAVVIASTCELLHNASLVHDDLQDRDSTRRGVDAVWKRFDAETAICTGDLLLSSAYASLADLDDATPLRQMLSLVHLRTTAAIQGQCADVAHRTTPVTDVATYLRIVAGKSGALLSLPLELVLLAAEQSPWTKLACDAAQAFAIGYQIADDLQDVSRDTGSDAATQALNVVLLMQRDVALAPDASQELRSAHARQQAIALARQQLTLAARNAAALPHQCGNLLAQLANDLARQW